MKRKIYKDLKSYILETGITQKALAQRLGVSQNCISLVVNGKRTPRPRLARAIVAEARIPLETLMTGTD